MAIILNLASGSLTKLKTPLDLYLIGFKSLSHACLYDLQKKSTPSLSVMLNILYKYILSLLKVGVGLFRANFLTNLLIKPPGII
jgi:hypothetical protein